MPGCLDRAARSLLGWLLILLLASPDVSAAQSLAELARNEQLRRERVRSPSRSYTNDDLDMERPATDSTAGNQLQPADTTNAVPSPAAAAAILSRAPHRDGAVIESAEARHAFGSGEQRLLPGRHNVPLATVAHLAGASRPIGRTDVAGATDASVDHASLVIASGPANEVVAPPTPAATEFETISTSPRVPNPVRSVAWASRPAVSNLPRVATPPRLTDWQGFVIPKTEAEKTADWLAEERATRPAPGRKRPTNPPPQHESIRAAAGLAYVQDADFGAELSAGGSISGIKTDFSNFLTMGHQGVEFRSGHLSLLDPEAGWGVEAGDLFTELRGLSRGLRFSWRGGETRRPAVSLYVASHGAVNEPTVVTYRDQVQLFNRISFGAEVASNGSGFVRGRYLLGALDLDTFYRYRPDDPGRISGHDKGFLASYGLWRGISLGGGLRLSETNTGDSEWRIVSLRLPIQRRVSVTLERNQLVTETSDSVANAVVMNLPVGPVRFFQRYQWGELEYLQRDLPFGFDRRRLQTVASYRATRWANFNYQVSTEWREDGRAQQWEELQTTLRLTPSTRLQTVTAFPDVLEPRRLRARLSQDLWKDFTLVAEYGRLSAFQQTRAVEGEQSRFLVMLRKNWQMQTPARGGEVRGRVIDEAGQGVAGAVVRLGPYSAMTDDDGRYAFYNVPRGSFELSLDQTMLPASFSSDGSKRLLAVTSSTREVVNLAAVPLQAIQGRVYWDMNSNRSYDSGEEVPGAVLHLNGLVTATDRNGTYGFYNQPPGTHTVRLDAARLPQGFVPASPPDVVVQLEGTRSVVGVDFRVTRKERPIFMREWR